MLGAISHHSEAGGFSPVASIVANMTDEEKAAKLQRLNGAMDFITKHFAVLSIAAAIFGTTAAIIFIAAYLRGLIGELSG